MAGMAPSRGLNLLVNSRCSPRLSTTVRCSRAFGSFSEKLASPTNKVQSYVSRTNDPYLNLSIEDHILRTSPPDSTVLFLYTNRPCVVIGRNQNPWTEVNLGILDAATRTTAKDTEPPAIGDVALVRRRSGGGTVFHDEGNLNWSVTSPRDEFTRDKSAEMVVRALRKLGVGRARVNERHDIVLDQGHEKHPVDPLDTHKTPYTVDDGPRPLKVSGSAYKLIRARALHHATTLLASPNLHIIPQYLRSPAKAFIDAKGVESVSSPVGNIGIETGRFLQHLQDEFAAMYATATPSGQYVAETVGDELLNVPEIRKGYDELRTQDWIWSQTPQFKLNLPMPGSATIEIDVHHGIIKGVEAPDYSATTLESLRSALLEQKLQDVRGWNKLLKNDVESWHDEYDAIAAKLEELLPVPKLPGL
ncbi:hypothetical protein BS50DRAFT_637373 [Corynespora cassiicola Philippines]|uniref:Putative lipoate-protein ligase A n=1 Tax=Corynespora cassiicola Philippines TaxID=1448308 RepID=A0A2T2NF65_CORCC|nr:hypothetical protein BS50DRAFT_637373 [Corynespora cassiicola Philippines]